MTRRLTPVNTIDRRFEQVVPKKVIEVYARERDLDSPLALITNPPPPSVSIPEDRRVTVDFYVDQEGKPRLPVILSTDDPLLSDIALETINEWRFTPPTRDGKPAITRARQEFVFHGEDQEETDAAT